MAGYTSAELREMVQPDRVHRAIYTDPAIFEIEMEKIFRRAWLYVGHESLVPNPGDFYCTHLARQPVVLSRHGGRRHLRAVQPLRPPRRQGAQR